MNLSTFRVIAETVFYSNNVKKLSSIKEAYELAYKNTGTIISDQYIYEPEKNGFEKNSKTLIFNDGEVVGRTAAARKIFGEKDVSKDKYSKILREAVFQLSKNKTNYHAQAFIGLDKDFIVKANILIPEFYENNVLSWLCNFQETNQKFLEMFKENPKYDNDEIFIVTDPEWKSSEFPYGLTFFSPEENTAFILGMRYFGEFKKGTLTLAWGLADRNNYASCHGGMKCFNDLNFVCAFFGLSGSGKSTLTHAKYENKHDITILHDDAFIIDSKTHESIALEPAYFDKTSDYKVACEDNKFILTAQNIGVSFKNGKKVLVTEDIRNENGRAIKSKLWSPNRVDKLDKKINAIFWLMKDSSIPPILKINDPTLASTLGATLATKRSSAERLAVGVDPNLLVFEPYANPFRTYCLKNDYFKFKSLFEQGVSCYILNTGSYLDQKIPASTTLYLIEQLAKKDTINFIEINKRLSYSFDPLKNSFDLNFFKEQMKKRIQFLENLDERNKLPIEAINCLKALI